MKRIFCYLSGVFFVFGLLGCDAAPKAESEDAADAGAQAPPERQKYAGGWYKALCADEIQSTGTREGDIVPDFIQMDQYGEDLRLYDFCDRHIWLVGSAYW